MDRVNLTHTGSNEFRLANTYLMRHIETLSTVTVLTYGEKVLTYGEKANTLNACAHHGGGLVVQGY